MICHRRLALMRQLMTTYHLDYQEHYLLHMLLKFEDRQCLIDAETIKNIKSKQSFNLISIKIEAIIDSLEHIIPINIIKIIYSILYSPQIESTMIPTNMYNYECVAGCLIPHRHELVPCVMISIPCCSKSMISYRLSSMKLKLQNIKHWGGGKYYVCIQEFETEYISRFEDRFINNINLELMNDTLYLLYIITELSEKLSVD
eukprot:223336_1